MPLSEMAETLALFFLLGSDSRDHEESAHIMHSGIKMKTYQVKMTSLPLIGCKDSAS